MKTKLIGILICMLLIATALPAVGTTTIQKTKSNEFQQTSATKDVIWSDNFDSYTLDQLLDGDPDDGGWRLCGCPYPSAGGYVINNQALSNPHSLEVVEETDIVQDFTRICSGNWTLTYWTYVPSDFSDKSGFSVDSYHPIPWNGNALMRQLTVYLNGDAGLVQCRPVGPMLPLITDQWIEIRLEIDFETDWLECYYDDVLLIAKNWTEDITPGFTGFRNLAAITVSYATSAMNTPVYHDDFQIQGIAGPEHELDGSGDLSWLKVPAGSIQTGSFIIENIGEPNSRLEWMIAEYPDFGTWTCDPIFGSLTPEDGAFTVNVTVNVPNQKNQNYSGELVIRAICDPAEILTIPIEITTPKNHPYIFNNPVLSWLIERFPNAFSIIRSIFEI